MKNQLIEHVSSSLGKRKVAELQPMVNIDEIQHAQNSTFEGTKVLRLKGQVPLGGIRDIIASVKRAQIGGMLNEMELLDISSTVYGGRRFKKFIEDMIENAIELPILEELVRTITPLTDVEREIKMCIDDHGHVLDSASPTLRTIRHQIKSHEASVRSKLESIIRSSSSQKMLSDSIITIRNDRYVIPVKQEYRNNFGGLVHDQSASGATLFIEPQAVVAINNQLREVRVKEKQEIEKILHALSAAVAEVGEELLQNVRTLAEVDFIFAKALYAKAIKATQPKLNDIGFINMKRARHPLIAHEEVVPIDIELGKSYSSIVITGPNTGGKTVTLKTTGLLTLMMQSGLHVPIDEGSEMAIFQSVYADIGDEQSIEQNLSTFSSHMVNIIDILEHVDHQSLVLFDELGAGTDPTEGAALAIAILDDVYQRGARIVATTHYSELKAYAYNRPGAINASVEFDVETLSPTYRLLIGVPGRSNAFAISKRLGLNIDIIEKAKAQISTETNKVENMITSLETSQKMAEKEMEEAVKIREEAEALRKDLADKFAQFELEKDMLIEQAEKKAFKVVETAKEEAEFIIEELRELQKEANVVKEHQLIDAKKRLDETAPKQKDKKKKGVVKNIIKELFPGDEVNVTSFNQKGHIVDKVSDREFLVQIGIMKMKVAMDDLQLIDRPRPIEKKPVATVRGNSHHVKPELDLRGERFEDAMLRVEKYLDDALLAGYSQVSIIHGKGTGALRKGVLQLLKTHPHVKSSKMAGMSEGGLGNTIVEFK
ncbi:endonuclease MutS2 [Anaerobacillus alkaliphilus]|uniref:Endonuclease MutS2 n=1 Tax=Anaerobacillus alkaliphilus TaxID=1548597 RepID=A0A4Q0VR56_9BACI|nr:endonuclease MutS2 [Anaerobacillus alkaliphilus]